MKTFIVLIGTLFFLVSCAVNESQALPVTNLNNSGPGSLRQTIINAAPGETIIFAHGLSGSIFLSSPIQLNKNLTIRGPGANILAVHGQSSPTESRVFEQTTGNILISDLRITNGFSSGGGGGIQVEGGSLTLNSCLINGNTAESGGGVVVFTGATLTITNSTIIANESFVEGGGLSNRGGTLILKNSTITANIAPLGGGVSVDNGGTTAIINCTISNNGVLIPSVGDIGGLRIAPGSTVQIKNTIVAENIGSPTAPPDVGGTVNSQGTNLVGNTIGSTGFTTALGDLLNVNPQLGLLLYNGGPTQTQALSAGSPAINAGNNTGAPATDQRGAVRPQGATVDIGAFEYGISGWSGQTNAGSNVTANLGTISVTFSGVSSAGITSQVPIDPTSVGNLPNGYSLGSGYPAYEISTTATYTAPLVVCLQVSGTTSLETFNALRILHYVNGAPTDSTILAPDSPAPDFATKTICARVNSLSPFVVAENLAPSASNVRVGGKVLTSEGRGISRARISITNQMGETRNVLTNAFGYYIFDEVAVGETYIISVSHKSFQFAGQQQVVFVADEISDLDFNALPE